MKLRRSVGVPVALGALAVAAAGAGATPAGPGRNGMAASVNGPRSDVAAARVTIRVDRRRVGMGRTVRLTASAALPGGKPAAGWLLLPYVDGRRWGAHELADESGRAVWTLPLSRPGVATLQVEARPPDARPPPAGARPVVAPAGDMLLRLPYLVTGYTLRGVHPVSNALRVEVERRRLRTIPADPNRLVGAQWCPLYTPHWFTWDTAQAVPLVGFYRTWDPNVIRQHVIWLAESGVDFLVVDWVNQLWGCQKWEQRDERAIEIIHATNVLMENLAALREEGLPVPRVLLMLGLNNGPSNSVEALNGEMAWVYDNYVRNPRLKGLLQEYLGKPLVLVFNGGGPEWLKANVSTPVDETRFTVRYQSAQHQICRHNEAGYWSWMDGKAGLVTLHDGAPEAMTVSVAYFDDKGWTGPTAHGRRGGRTYLEAFAPALLTRPRFLQIHQFRGSQARPRPRTGGTATATARS